MRRFFKDMPIGINEKGVWEIQVYAVFPLKDSVVWSESYTGLKGLAYVKVRWKALLKDWSTSGQSYGIAWSLDPIEEM